MSCVPDRYWVQQDYKDYSELVVRPARPRLSTPEHESFSRLNCKKRNPRHFSFCRRTDRLNDPRLKVGGHSKQRASERQAGKLTNIPEAERARDQRTSLSPRLLKVEYDEASMDDRELSEQAQRSKQNATE